MKIFVTGATGYIGQKLVARLINQGDRVHMLCRQVPEAELFSNQRVVIFKGDLSDVNTLQAAMQGCEQVYHVAAYARVWSKNPADFFEINVKGTVNVLEAALQNKVAKLVFTSTGGTLGVSNGTPISETTIRTVDFFNEYESSKFMAEEKVMQYVQRGLHAVIVHPTRVYGPGTWSESNALSLLIKHYLSGDWHLLPAGGKAKSCFAYIDDVVDGHLKAMQQGRSGERYILGGVNSDLYFFFQVLRKLSNKNHYLFNVPLPLLMIYGFQEEVSARLFGKYPRITSKWVKKYNLDAAFSSQKAIDELGYRITTLESGLKRTLAWLRNEQRIYF